MTKEKIGKFTVKQVGAESDRVLRFIGTDESEDRDGDIIMAAVTGELLGMVCCAQSHLHVNMSHKDYVEKLRIQSNQPNQPNQSNQTTYNPFQSGFTR